MRSSFASLLSLALLSGCAGYASDYWKSKDSLIGRQLPRYGLDGQQGECVAKALTKNLSVWQLRQLADHARRLARGGQPGALGPRDLSYVAGLVPDPKVGPEVSRALQSCGSSSAIPAANRTPVPAAIADPGKPPVELGTPPAPLRWVDLGKAETGQAIAVDITSVVTTGTRREGWFRLSNPGEPSAQPVGYRLRVDCAARTITPLGARKYGEDGKVAQQEDYTGAWQQPLTIEAGTVMEIAFRSVCA
ncbi:MAG TPA: hypothetical protein VGB59_02525 [Allosphingosinicella sp.]